MKMSDEEHPKDRCPLMCFDEERLIVSGCPSFSVFLSVQPQPSLRGRLLLEPRGRSSSATDALSSRSVYETDLGARCSCYGCPWRGGGLSGQACCGWDTARNLAGHPSCGLETEALCWTGVWCVGSSYLTLKLWVLWGVLSYAGKFCCNKLDEQEDLNLSKAGTNLLTH